MGWVDLLTHGTPLPLASRARELRHDIPFNERFLKFCPERVVHGKTIEVRGGFDRKSAGRGYQIFRIDREREIEAGESRESKVKIKK